MCGPWLPPHLIPLYQGDVAEKVPVDTAIAIISEVLNYNLVSHLRFLSQKTQNFFCDCPSNRCDLISKGMHYHSMQVNPNTINKLLAPQMACVFPKPPSQFRHNWGFSLHRLLASSISYRLIFGSIPTIINSALQHPYPHQARIFRIGIFVGEQLHRHETYE